MRKSELEGKKLKDELEDGTACDRPRGVVNDETAVSETLIFD